MTSLDLAIIYWEQGHNIPLDLAAILLSEGLDVEALESKYFK